MRKISKAIGLGLWVSLLPVSAFAAPPSVADIDKLMQLTDVDSMVESLYGQVGGMFQRYAQQLQVNEAERAIVDRYFQQAVQAIKQDITWQTLQPPMRDVYMNHFTDEEVKQLITFYSSPLGQRLVKKLPQVMRESVGVTQSSLQQVMPKVQQIAQNMANEIQTQRQGGQ